MKGLPVNLIIDREFQELLPALSPEESKQLEEQLVALGCQDTIKVWKGHKIILDGHNRYRICTARKIPFETVNLTFGSRADALEWIIKNQLGRRNLTAESRQRMVLALRKEGQSFRKIAETLHVGVGTVHRDLCPKGPSHDAKSVPFGTPAVPAGPQPDADEPAYVGSPSADDDDESDDHRHKSNGKPAPVPAPPPNAGDAWEPPKPGTEPPAPTGPKPKTGQVTFDPRKLTDGLGGVVRLVEECGKAKGKGARYDAMNAALETALGEWKEWRKEMA